MLTLRRKEYYSSSYSMGGRSMVSVKSPGGSMFPYYYKGGEIHCLKYGSMYKDGERLFKLMKEEEAFIIEANRKLKIWVDFLRQQ
jgi:hypothetical protein